MEDGRDEGAAGASVIAEKRRRKQKANLDTTRLDNNPVPLSVGLQVLLQDDKTRKWDIRGEVTFVRPSGRSAIIYVPSRGNSYLRNRRYIKINPEYEFEEDEVPNQLCMTYGKSELLCMRSSAMRTNRKLTRKKERRLSFSDVDRVGQAGELVPTKVLDGKDKEYHTRIKKLKVI